MSSDEKGNIVKPDPSQIPPPEEFGYVLNKPEPWVPIFFDKHWGQGGSVPTTTISCENEEHRIEIVAEAALPLPAFGPIIVKEEYPVILKKLEKQLDRKPKGANVIRTDKDGLRLYKQADHESSKPPPTRGVCIFGHPGSGKSTSLIYLLIALLRRKQPVLYIPNRIEHAILFTDSFSGLVCTTYIEILRHVTPLVILYDAMAKEIPTSWYGNKFTNFYIVLATSPQIKQFSPWIKRGVKCLTMEPFSKAEVASLVSLDADFYKGKGRHSALVMYDYLGPSLKVLKEHHVKILADSSEENDFATATTDLWEAVHNVSTDLWTESSIKGVYDWMAVGTDREPPAYHRFFMVKPIKDGKRWTSVPSYKLELITKFMGLIFISAVQQKTDVEDMAFASHFMSSPSISGLIFEKSTIRYLSYAPKPSTVFMGPGTENLTVPSFLTTHPDLLNFAKSPPERQKLHVAPIGAATLDGLYEMEDGTKLLFQMTIAQRHGISDMGLKKILECYRSQNSELGFESFVLVFVVPDKKSKRKYLKTWAKGKEVKVSGQPQTLRVGVMIIDALQARLWKLRDLIHSEHRKVITRDGKVLHLPPATPASPRPVNPSSAPISPSDKRGVITKDGKDIVSPPDVPSTSRPAKPFSVPTSPSHSVSIYNYSKVIVTSPNISPARFRDTAPFKRKNATREGTEGAPGPSKAKRTRLDAGGLSAESPAPAAMLVMEDEGQVKPRRKRQGKGKARQVDE